MKCPVCKKPVTEKQSQCPNPDCGWEFVAYLTDIPDGEKARYEQKLAAARKAYQEKMVPAYRRETPIPEFQRDPFETGEEFRERITKHPPLFAGTATLVKEKYDIKTGFSPSTFVGEWPSERLAFGAPGHSGPGYGLRDDPRTS